MVKQVWTKIVWPAIGTGPVDRTWARVFPRFPEWVAQVVLAAYVPSMFGVKGEYCYRTIGLTPSLDHAHIFSGLAANERDQYTALKLRVVRYLYRQITRRGEYYEVQLGLLRRTFPRELRLIEVATPAAVTRAIKGAKAAPRKGSQKHA